MNDTQCPFCFSDNVLLEELGSDKDDLDLWLCMSCGKRFED